MFHITFACESFEYNKKVFSVKYTIDKEINTAFVQTCLKSQNFRFLKND